MGQSSDGSRDAGRLVDAAAGAGRAKQSAAQGGLPAGRRQVALTATLTSLVWLAVGGLLLVLWRQPEPVAFQIAPPPATATTPLVPTATPAPVLVDVGGAVRAPGVYQLPPGSRVRDAVDAAGGLAVGADLRSINLASILSDGAKVYVVTEGETLPAVAPDAEVAPRSPAIAIDEPGVANGALPRININTATLEDLDTLPGIGPKTAQAILDYRQANGLFKSVEDLLDVKGIGDATLAALRDLVTVEESP